MNDNQTKNNGSGIGNLRVRLSDIRGVKPVQVKKHLSKEKAEEPKSFYPSRDISLIRKKVVNNLGLAEDSHHFFPKPGITSLSQGC